MKSEITVQQQPLRAGIRWLLKVFSFWIPTGTLPQVITIERIRFFFQTLIFSWVKRMIKVEACWSLLSLSEADEPLVKPWTIIIQLSGETSVANANLLAVSCRLYADYFRCVASFHKVHHELIMCGKIVQRRAVLQSISSFITDAAARWSQTCCRLLRRWWGDMSIVFKSAFQICHHSYHWCVKSSFSLLIRSH